MGSKSNVIVYEDHDYDPDREELEERLDEQIQWWLICSAVLLVIGITFNVYCIWRHGIPRWLSNEVWMVCNIAYAALVICWARWSWRMFADLYGGRRDP